MNRSNNEATDYQLPCRHLIVRGRILLPRSFHVGSGEASLLTDSPVRRNRQGQPYIPGSSLAGLLRSTAEDFAPYLCSDPDKTVRRLFGRKKDDDPRREDSGSSRLIVEDACISELLPGGIAVREIRDYVGIDRCRAAAREHLQYDIEVAPGNTSYDFEVSIEEPGGDDVRLLLAVLDFWCEYGLQVGARTTTGLGEARIDKESLKLYCLDFKKTEVLKSYLLDGGDTAQHIPASAEINRPPIAPFINTSFVSKGKLFYPEHLFITVALIMEEPLLIKGNIPEVPDLPDDKDMIEPSKQTSDTQFITALRWHNRTSKFEPELYIPGSSLKGVFRTRAEKIVRTLNFYRGYAGSAAAEADPGAAEKYEERITACAITHAGDNTRARLEACFGSRTRQITARRKKGNEIYDRSCPICRLFGNSMMRGRLTCSEAAPVPALKTKLFDHVAIDRFTGGAADVKKFDTRPVMPVVSTGDLSCREKAFTFRLHLERPELWMLGLLGHLLKDLNTADIRIGHATRRGYGRVRGYVQDAVLLALPDTNLMNICRAMELDTDNKFAVYGPHSEVGLTDWENIFGPAPWCANGPDASWRETPGGKLLAKADGAFQELIKKAEGQEFGEFHDTTNNSH